MTISMRSGAWNPAITATNNKFVLKLKYSITHFTMRKKTTTKSKQQVKAVEPKMTMPCRITIRLTEEQMKLVANNAALKGHKPSAYCRQVILGRKVRDLSPDTRSYRQTLTNLGNNLNQLVRHMNTNGSNKNDIAKAMAMVTDIKQLKSNLDKS